MLSKNTLLNIAYKAIARCNDELGTEFSKENVKLEFFNPRNGKEIYLNFCKKYFPDWLVENIDEDGYFESFAAEAFIGDECDGILIREDIDFNKAEWYHTFIHELSHIACSKEEIEGGHFFKRYCINYADNTTEDGYINAGYAIWREFIAECFAREIDENNLPFCLYEIKPLLLDMNARIEHGNPIAKVYLSQLLINLFTSDEFYESEKFEQFEKALSENELKEILDLKPVLALIFNHAKAENNFMIDVDFIEALGNAYITVLSNRLFLKRMNLNY